ncbi:MAG: hypothetical protein JXR25_03895 [Pontiellaceae bacterium]|nr:hypothetical protein [Pontiellaceae bacterium]MBN2783944.1 hypothetical protein [Pontiellaceae bacterium]
MLDFWLPMLLLFLTATIAAIAARRKRDRCLKYFNREPVMILLGNGKWLWGRLNVFPKAVELAFENPEKDDAGCCKASYVLYAPEVDSIAKILQPPPTAGTKEYEKWQREIKRIANPSLMRRFRRWLWNAFNTLRDAVSQSLGMILGSLKSKTAMGRVANADKRAGEIGNTLLGTVPNAYEPILEKYLSKQVVVEMLENGEVVELAGLLQEYSDKYLLLRNVAYCPETTQGPELPERIDMIFPRSRALVRHCVANIK